MTANASQPTTTPRPQKLAIVHLLGWMAGVGLVLAIYRANTDATEYPADWILSMRLTQLGMGLAYGTAISGLGLFLWRWWSGAGSGPTQPGHWLLVLGGMGLLLDFGTTAAIQGVLLVSGAGIKITYFPAWVSHQVVVWWIASQIALVVLLKARDAPFWWWGVALAAFLALSANAVANNVSLVAHMAGASGMWVWHMPLIVRITGEALMLLALCDAVYADLRARLPRDWLHAGGVLAGVGLGLVDLVTSAMSLWR